MPSGSGLARVIKRRWRPLVGISLIGRRAGIAADYPDIGRLVGYGGCAGIRRREGRGKRQRRHCHAMTKQFVSHYPTYEGDSYTYVAYVLCARTSTHTHLYTHTYTLTPTHHHCYRHQNLCTFLFPRAVTLMTTLNS